MAPELYRKTLEYIVSNPSYDIPTFRSAESTDPPRWFPRWFRGGRERLVPRLARSAAG